VKAGSWKLVAMHIYLACTVRGDRVALDAARVLCARLEEAGHTVPTKHLLADDADAAEAALTARAVYERDMARLERCDILVAEASGSSYGVGFEVGYVLGRSTATTKRVVLLYKRDREDRISRFIPGVTHQRCTTIAYNDPGELADQVLAVLDEVRSQELE
jgi:nucleoside 2-deoxyribosyltransferase